MVGELDLGDNVGSVVGKKVGNSEGADDIGALVG